MIEIPTNIGANISFVTTGIHTKVQSKLFQKDEHTNNIIIKSRQFEIAKEKNER